MDNAFKIEREVAAAKRTRWSDSLAATRQSLLTRIKRVDDHEGWWRFVETYAGVIRALAMRSGLSETEADDVLQDTLVSVAKEIPGFKYDPSRGSFKGWLFRIARRRVADQFRARIRYQREIDNGTEVALSETENPGDPLGQIWEEEWRQSQIHHAVERVKKKVSSQQWQMFDLAVLQELPTAKVCTLLGINRAQLYMAKMRVGRLLKAEVNRLPAEDILAV